MANRPKKTPANPGRASIDIGGIAKVFGAGAGPKIVEDSSTLVSDSADPSNPYAGEEGESQGVVPGETKQSMPQLKVEGKAPGRFRNILTQGQAGENYQRAVNQVNMTNSQNRFSLMADEIQANRSLQNAQTLQQSNYQLELDRAENMRQAETDAQNAADMETGVAIANAQGVGDISPEAATILGRSHRFQTKTLPELNKNTAEKAEFDMLQTEYGQNLLADSTGARIGKDGRAAMQDLFNREATRVGTEATRAATEATRSNIPINEARAKRDAEEFDSFNNRTKRRLVDLGGVILSEGLISDMGTISGNIPAVPAGQVEVLSPDGMTTRKVNRPPQAGRIETQSRPPFEDLGSVEEMLRKARLMRQLKVSTDKIAQ